MSDQDLPEPSSDTALEPDSPSTGESVEGDSILDKIPSTAPAEGIVLGMGTLNEGDERTMAFISHLLGAVTWFVASLIVWQVKKGESPFVEHQAKEALNFQITIGCGYLVAMILGHFTGGCLSAILLPVFWIYSAIYCILAAMDANKGVAFRYPFVLRLVS